MSRRAAHYECADSLIRSQMLLGPGAGGEPDMVGRRIVAYVAVVCLCTGGAAAYALTSRGVRPEPERETSPVDDWLDVWATYDLEAIPTRPEPHVVQPGETLWSIAERYRLPGDLRMTVDIIRELNSLWGPDGPRLRVGQRLKVPEPDREQWPLAMRHAWD